MGGVFSLQPRIQFDLVRVMPDDRSLFRALDIGRYLLDTPGTGDPWQRLEGLSPEDKEARADALRAQVCDELLARRAELQEITKAKCGRIGSRYSGGAFNFEAYRNEMREPWVPAGELELMAAPHVLHRPILVYRAKDMRRGRPGRRYGEQQYSGEDPIHLLHYSGAEDIEAPFVGRGYYGLLVPASW